MDLEVVGRRPVGRSKKTWSRRRHDMDRKQWRHLIT